MNHSVDDRRLAAPLARRDEGAYSPHVTDEQRRQRGWIGAENSVDDGRLAAPLARRDEGAYSPHVTDEQRRQRGWIGAENDRAIHTRAPRRGRDSIAGTLVLP
jgi:hypothetical protein